MTAVPDAARWTAVATHLRQVLGVQPGSFADPIDLLGIATRAVVDGDIVVLTCAPPGETRLRVCFPQLPDSLLGDVALDFGLGGLPVTDLRWLYADRPTGGSVPAALIPSGWTGFDGDVAAGGGLLLSGMIEIAAIPGIDDLAHVFGIAPRFPVNGQVDYACFPPVLRLTHPLPDVGPLSDAVMVFSSPLTGFGPPGIGIEAQVDLGGGDTLAMSAELATDGGWLRGIADARFAAGSALLRPLTDPPLSLELGGIEAIAAIDIGLIGGLALVALRLELRLDRWVIHEDLLVLDAVDLRLVCDDPLGRPLTRMNFSAEAGFGVGGAIRLHAAGSWPDGDVQLGLPAGTTLTLAQIGAALEIAGLGDGFDITTLTMIYNVYTRALDARIAVRDDWSLGGFVLTDVSFSIKGTPEAWQVGASAKLTLPGNIVLTLSLNHAAGAWAIAGELTLAEARFTISTLPTAPAAAVTPSGEAAPDTGPTAKGDGSILHATWEAGPSGGLRFAALAKHLSIDLRAVPAALLPELRGLELTYATATKVFVLAVTTGHGTGTFVTVPIPGGRGYAGCFALDVDLSLGNLPVVGGSIVAAGADFGIDRVELIFSAGGVALLDVPELKAVFSGLAGLPPPAALGVVVRQGDTTQSVFVPLGGPAETLPATAGDPSTDGPPAAPAPAAPIAAPTWVRLDAAAGPVLIRRIGLAWHDQRLWLSLDVGFHVAALSIDLIGLGLGAAFRPFSLSVSLDGLGVRYADPAVTIGGALVAHQVDGRGCYDGQITLAAARFQIAAVASYTTDAATHPSLFAFAFLDAPLGGPPFCYVTGVAAAFGVNRDLVMPAAEDLPDFPLIKAVMGGGGLSSTSGPAQVIAKLGTAVPVRSGASWVAVGLRFTTFKLLNSFALASVRFGGEVAIDVIGTSSMSIPPETANPIAFAEIGFAASYKPAEGVLRMGARLTPASYILSPDCRLTGGYGLGAWFKDQGGLSAGHFVVTMGGYHPSFRPPDAYPTEPRLAAIWRVDANLTVTGTYYFALTPNAVMAGGSLSAVWQSGNFHAWFDFHADFLLSWKPFHYEASIGLSVGASYHVHVWFVSFDVTVHVGVELELHGPPFGGAVSVDIGICTIRIGFGDSGRSSHAQISWDEFKQSFLPAPHAGAGDEANRFIVPMVASGLVRDLTHDAGYVAGQSVDWTIVPETFGVTISLAVPAKTAALGRGIRGGLATLTALPGGNDQFGVGPAGIADDHFTSHIVVTVEHGGSSPNFVASPIWRNVPAAQWSQAVAMGDADPLGGHPPLIENVLGGVALSPLPVVPGTATKPIDLARLQITNEGPPAVVQWSRIVIPAATRAEYDVPRADIVAALGNPVIDLSRAAKLRYPPRREPLLMRAA